MEAKAVGIDVAQASFEVEAVKGEHHWQGSFNNEPSEFNTFKRWLVKHGFKKGSRVCLEATGRYGDELAWFLYEAGYAVSVVNPLRIKAYAESRLSRNKTDQLDAALIADFCRTQQPDLWTPPSPQQRELQGMVRHLANLETMRQQDLNRLHAKPPSQIIRQTLQEHITFLDQQIERLKAQIQSHIDQWPDLKQQRDLLDSIPGIAALTASKLMAELPDLARLESADQLVAHAGLNPRLHRSGSSVRGNSHLSKLGNAALRTALYMPALVAKTHSPTFRTFALRLQANGKSKMQAVGAVMRKLLRLVYAVLKSGKPFDPHFLDQKA